LLCECSVEQEKRACITKSNSTSSLLKKYNNNYIPKKLDTPDPNTDIPKVIGVTPQRFRDMSGQLGEIYYHSMTSLNELRLSLDSILDRNIQDLLGDIPYHLGTSLNDLGISLNSLGTSLNYKGISLCFMTSLNGLGTFLNDLGISLKKLRISPNNLGTFTPRR